MSAKTVRITNILAAAMLLLNAGCILLNLLLVLLTNNAMFSLPAGIFLCLALLLPTIVLLIVGIKQKLGVFHLIASIATLIVCTVWLVASALDWGLSIAQDVIIDRYYSMEIDIPLGQLISILSYIFTAYTLLTIIVALYLLIVYVVSVLRSKQKWLQIKAELHKPALAVVILVPGVLYFVRLVLNRIMMTMSMEAYSTYSMIAMYVQYGVSILLPIAAAVVLLTVGLIFKKQAATEESVMQPEHPFADIDLPVGVSADSTDETAKE